MIDFINGTKDCCGNIELNDIDNKASDSLSLFSDIIFDVYNKAASDLVFYHSKSTYTIILNDLKYLLMYLTFLGEIIDQDKRNGIEKAFSVYYDEYNLGKIKKYFLCKNIDIDPIIEIWKELDATITISGIGYMLIEDSENPFKIY